MDHKRDYGLDNPRFIPVYRGDGWTVQDNVSGDSLSVTRGSIERANRMAYMLNSAAVLLTADDVVWTWKALEAENG